MKAIFAIHPRHAEAILDGRKRIELRVRAPRLTPGTTVYLYSTAPVSAVVGGFVTGEVVEASARELWRISKDEAAVSAAEFRSYLRGRRGKAIRIVAPFRLRRPAPREEMTKLSPGYVPPQSVAVLRDSVLEHHLARLEQPGRGGFQGSG